MKKELSTIITIFILLSALGISPLSMDVSGNLSDENLDSKNRLNGNISITSDDELKEFVSEYELPGNGTGNEPFILENHTIDAHGENHSIDVEYTELHFVIRDCKIYNSSKTGIKINRVSNFTLEKSVVKNSTTGINIESSENISIKGSSIYNTTKGVNVKSSENISIKGSSIYNTTESVKVKSSENLIIKGSSIYNNDRGIYLRENATNNTLTKNNISNNEKWGVSILESNHNLIYHNIFFENNNQALDNGDNQWDDGEMRGNYWSDYEEKYPDANESMDIWDTSYEILGDDNRDEYPLISPIGPPTDVRIQPRDGAAKLNWSEPAYSIMYDVESIKIYRGMEEKNLSIYKNLTADPEGFMDESLTNGEEYYYSLIVNNEKYESVSTKVEKVVPDGTTPELIDFSPDGDEVPVDTNIMVSFSEEMKEGSIEIVVEDPDGEDIQLEEIEREPQSEATEFYFEPKENLSYETSYEVSVNASDKALNWLESLYTWSFTTVSDTGIIKGRIVNEEGEPLENVKVYVDEDHQTFTNRSGGFQMEVPSGNITLEISREEFESKEREIHVNQGDEKKIEDIILREREGIISRWFWPIALVGGGTILLGILALVIFFHQWGDEEPPPDEDIYDVDYEDVNAEEFESWWEDEES